MGLLFITLQIGVFIGGVIVGTTFGCVLCQIARRGKADADEA